MLNWREYLMGFALHAAVKSKDETQVGAALIAPGGKDVILTGYNGPPAGVEDSPARRERPLKYLFCVHAEQNTISKAARYGIRTEGCELYVTHKPCDRCAVAIIQAGIKRVIYGPGKTRMPQEQFDAAQVMFYESGVKCEAIDVD
jgi:dCMP deaminase